MSKYTTEVRYICESFAGYDESVGYKKVNEIIDLAKSKVFDFEYPIFDEAYRPILEKKILKHFYTREIGEETVGLWKLRLDTKMNEIMPYYNKLYRSELVEFNPLYTENMNKVTAGNTKTDTTSNEKDASKTAMNSVSSSTDATNSNTNTNSTGKANTNSVNANHDLYSDTPQGSINALEDNTYLTNARVVTDNAVGHSENNNASNSNANVNSTGTNLNSTLTDHNKDIDTSTKMNTVEDYIVHTFGYRDKVPSDLLLKFRETFLNIDMLIISQLETLFFGLW